MSDTVIQGWFDGACFPHNPGGYASYGAVIATGGEIVWQGSGLVIPAPLEGTTNNIAEYAGYIAVLSELRRREWHEQPLLIHGDSQLVIKQMSGEWKIKKGAYAALALKAKALTKHFPQLALDWIPREQNALSDALAMKAIYSPGSLCVPCFLQNGGHSKTCLCGCHGPVESSLLKKTGTN